MSEYLDVGQWLSFVSGYRKATKLPKTSQGKINEFLRVANEDLRKLIEDATPAFFLFNSAIYTEACLDFAKDLETPNSGNLIYISHIVVNNVSIQKDEKQFHSELVKCLRRYSAPTFDKSTVIPKIATNKNTFQSFSSIVKKQLNALNSKIEREYLHLMTDNNPKKEWAAGKARFSTVAAGRAIRTGFQKLTPCVVLSPETIVEGFNSTTQEILLGSTFSNLRGSVNSILTPIAVKSFAEAGIILADTTKKSSNPFDSTKRFTIGEIVVFGHTGAKTTSDGLAELVGLNTPWTQQILLLAAEKGVQGEAFNLLNKFAVDSGQVNASVQFTKSVSDDVKVLMKGQLAIIVPMTVSQNKAYLQKETKAAQDLIESIFGIGATYRKVRSSLIDRVLSAASLKRLVTGLKFSPTLAQSLKEGLVSTIKTGKFKKSFAKSPKESISVTKENVVNNTSKRASTKKLALPKPKNKSVYKPKIVGVASSTSLANLLTKINADLHQQIRRNMGTGNSQNVLNYRTGRFAESVKVEKLSESRQGMITAFYSYMKNPYATFSQGGRQQYPRSRDPKLLISKSIREIAQTMVTNQLRAVNV